jgi:hypothetical protein
MYIIRYRDININKSFIVIMMFLTVFSLVNVYFGNDTFFYLTKQVLGILMIGSAYYFLIKINEFRVDKLFKIYLRIAIIVAAIGIFQEISYLIGFKYGYNYHFIIKKWWLSRTALGMLRLNSIFTEPAHFAITMAPALFVALVTLLKNNSFYMSKKASILIIASVILTISGIAYIAILLSLLIIFADFRKSKYLLLVVIILPIICYAIYRYVPDMRMRVDHSLGVVTGAKKVVDTNPSTYALSSNAFVAYKSFINNPFFGSGLGSHPISYDKFISSSADNGYWHKDWPMFNREDASSLFLRLVSETGLFGLVIVFYFIFRFRLKNNDNLSVMSNAIFVLFIMQLLRQGHYFYNGLFFFVWVYYFAFKNYNFKQA